VRKFSHAERFLTSCRHKSFYKLTVVFTLVPGRKEMFRVSVRRQGGGRCVAVDRTCSRYGESGRDKTQFASQNMLIMHYVVEVKFGL
jgi:hypothetical protein